MTNNTPALKGPNPPASRADLANDLTLAGSAACWLAPWVAPTAIHLDPLRGRGPALSVLRVLFHRKQRGTKKELYLAAEFPVFNLQSSIPVGFVRLRFIG